MTTCPAFLTLVYMPAGRSCPEERTVYRDSSRWYRPFEDVDAFVDAVVTDCWDADGDEPLDVRDPLGRVVWSNSRWGDLS
jgi:hypothetical protein